MSSSQNNFKKRGAAVASEIRRVINMYDTDPLVTLKKIQATQKTNPEFLEYMKNMMSDAPLLGSAQELYDLLHDDAKLKNKLNSFKSVRAAQKASLQNNINVFYRGRAWFNVDPMFKSIIQGIKDGSIERVFTAYEFLVYSPTRPMTCFTIEDKTEKWKNPYTAPDVFYQLEKKNYGSAYDTSQCREYFSKKNYKNSMEIFVNGNVKPGQLKPPKPGKLILIMILTHHATTFQQENSAKHPVNNGDWGHMSWAAVHNNTKNTNNTKKPNNTKNTKNTKNTNNTKKPKKKN